MIDPHSLLFMHVRWFVCVPWLIYVWRWYADYDELWAVLCKVNFYMFHYVDFLAVTLPTKIFSAAVRGPGNEVDYQPVDIGCDLNRAYFLYWSEPKPSKFGGHYWGNFVLSLLSHHICTIGNCMLHRSRKFTRYSLFIV